MQDTEGVGGGVLQPVEVGDEVQDTEGVGDGVLQSVEVEEKVLAGRADVKPMMARATAELETCMLTKVESRIEIGSSLAEDVDGM